MLRSSFVSSGFVYYFIALSENIVVAIIVMIAIIFIVVDVSILSFFFFFCNFNRLPLGINKE